MIVVEEEEEEEELNRNSNAIVFDAFESKNRNKFKAFNKEMIHFDRIRSFDYSIIRSIKS